MNPRLLGIGPPGDVALGDCAESQRLDHGHALAAGAAAAAPVTVAPHDVIPERRSFAARAGGVALAAWGAVTGVAPHVLHHVGPLAGAAFLAGAGGRLLFATIALVVSIPFLLRIHRRFRTWIAPAITLAVMVVAFALSTFVIGPAISGESANSAPGSQPKIDRPAHDEHGH